MEVPAGEGAERYIWDVGRIDQVLNRVGQHQEFLHLEKPSIVMKSLVIT